MKFYDILKEKKMQLTDKTKIGKKYNLYRGVNFIILGENEPPDVHGIPPKMEAYGRGGFYPNGDIFVDGGPSGSAQGHPTEIQDGFYWAVDYDAVWTGKDGKKRTGIMYVRGRAGTDENRLLKNIYPILDLLFKRLPRS